MLKNYLDPFAGMAVRAEYEETWNHWFEQSLPISAAVVSGIMAILILLIACFNFTNTSIASLIGSVGGYFMAEMLMASIWTYYVPIEVTAFIMAIIILFLVSGLTIGGNVIRSASMNPVNTLKDE